LVPLERELAVNFDAMSSTRQTSMETRSPRPLLYGKAQRIRREVVMTTDSHDQEYESYAHECVRLARLTSDQLIREKLMEMARQWMAASMRSLKVFDYLRTWRELLRLLTATYGTFLPTTTLHQGVEFASAYRPILKRWLGLRKGTDSARSQNWWAPEGYAQQGNHPEASCRRGSSQGDISHIMTTTSSPSRIASSIA
jgi:hypothetical protein